MLCLAAEKEWEKEVAEKLMKVGSLSFSVFGSRESGSFYLSYSNAASLTRKTLFTLFFSEFNSVVFGLGTSFCVRVSKVENLGF